MNANKMLNESTLVMIEATSSAIGCPDCADEVVRWTFVDESQRTFLASTTATAALRLVTLLTRDAGELTRGVVWPVGPLTARAALIAVSTFLRVALFAPVVDARQLNSVHEGRRG